MVKLRRIGGTNSVVITKDNGDEVLVSYSTCVAAIVGGKAYKTDTKWSVTTSRHINQFLHGRSAIIKPQSWFDKLI